MIIHLARRIISRLEEQLHLPLRRLIKFGLVGFSGVLVNMGLFFLFSDVAGFSYYLASPIAIEFSIVNNFLWNTGWTWKDRKTTCRKEKTWRFLKFHLISALSALVNYGILVLLVEKGGLNKYLANLAGIALGTGINFILNHFWTFGKKEFQR